MTETPAKPCPTCGKPAVRAHRPFCSARCAEVDLQRWFSARFAIPGPPAGEEDAD